MPRATTPAAAFAPLLPVDLALYLAAGGAVGFACRRRWDAALVPAGGGRFWPAVIDRRTGRETRAAVPEYPRHALLMLELMGVRDPAGLCWLPSPRPAVTPPGDR